MTIKVSYVLQFFGTLCIVSQLFIL